MSYFFFVKILRDISKYFCRYLKDPWCSWRNLLQSFNIPWIFFNDALNRISDAINFFLELNFKIISFSEWESSWRFIFNVLRSFDGRVSICPRSAECYFESSFIFRWSLYWIGTLRSWPTQCFVSHSSIIRWSFHRIRTLYCRKRSYTSCHCWFLFSCSGLPSLWSGQHWSYIKYLFRKNNLS